MRRAPRRIGGGSVVLAVAAVVAAACGPATDEGLPDSPQEAGRLVVGDWLGETGLLVLPRGGGQPEMRAAADPSLVVWRRDDVLPSLQSAREIGAQAVVLTTSDGAVYRWELDEERGTLVSDVGPDAGWGALDGATALRAPNRIVVADAAGRREWDVGAPVSWAAPVADDGVVALVEEAQGAVILVLDDASEVVGRLALPVRSPGFVTAWGRASLFLSPEGREIILLRVPDLQETGRFQFRRPVSAVALSASTHEVYVAHSGGRVEAVNRVSGNTRRLADLGTEVRELRPGIYGQQLLAVGEAGVFAIPLSGDAVASLPVEWRPDLPLGLPSGEVLAVRGDSLFLARPGPSGATAILEPVDGPADAWWLPVRWQPPEDRLATAESSEPGGLPSTDEADTADTAVADLAAGAEPSVDSAAVVDSVAAATAAGADSIGFSFAAPAAGYYAVGMASRTAGGVIELVRTLARSGYPTAVQRRRDDAGEMWYRALVGPYPARDRAEAAVRQLRRERGLDAWVIEITAGSEAEF